MHAKGIQKTWFKKGQFSKPASDSEKQTKTQILRGKKMSINDKLLEKEDHTYVPGRI